MTQKQEHSGRKLINRYYTLGEEIANSITHGIGAFLSVVGLTVLVVLASLRGDSWQLISFSIYGSTLFILYLASTLYHSIQHPKTKKIFQIIDHAAIFLLIAGTYTPFLLVSLRPVIGWSMLVTVWGLAVLGIAFKLIFAERFMVLSTLAYIGMGWLCVIQWNAMLLHLPAASLMWLAIGGVSYTAGVIFFSLHRLPYSHAIWHLFVLGGSAAHFWAILYLIPQG